MTHTLAAPTPGGFRALEQTIANLRGTLGGVKDERDALRAEVARLRAALEGIESESRGDCASTLALIRGAARAALEGAR